jgi:hypothetical protein
MDEERLRVEIEPEEKEREVDALLDAIISRIHAMRFWVECMIQCSKTR